MATLFRRPLLASVGLSAQPLNRRCFTQFPALRAQGPPSKGEAPRMNRTGEKSFRVLQSRSNGKDLPNDMGILEMTFIPPYSTVKLFSSPLKYLLVEYKRLRFKIRNILALMVFKVASPKDPNGRWYSRTVKLHSSRIKPTALALHKQMYSAFAEGDVPTLRKICTDGLFESFTARLAARKKGEQVVWELVQYNKRAKLVSNRGARYPIDGSGVMQAVVRIDSTQRLTRYGKDGEAITGSGKAKTAVEYLVLQKQYNKWEGADWRVWGTTEETDLDTLKEWEKDPDP